MRSKTDIFDGETGAGGQAEGIEKEHLRFRSFLSILFGDERLHESADLRPGRRLGHGLLKYHDESMKGFC